MAKIVQLGSYDRNIGDNIALYNIRHNMETNRPSDKQPLDWLNLDINTFHILNNSIQHSKNIFKDLQNNHGVDMLVIGGGGLFENAKRYDSGWKLPFTKEVLQEIKIPVVVYAAGINYFYNFPQLDEKAKEEVINLCKASDLFSLRNDGSYEIFKDFCGLGITELPDPGLVFDPQINQISTKNNISKGFFQPAWNNKPEQKKGRRFTDDNLNKINQFCSKNGLDNFCHTPKDYSFPWFDKEYVIPVNLFETACQYQNVLKTIGLYGKYDFSIALRGHGQLIAIGANLPSVYLSTQPKVLGFSEKNGFEDYTVDIRDEDWYDQLTNKIELLKNDESYLRKWYKTRDEKMILYRKQMNDFSTKVWELL